MAKDSRFNGRTVEEMRVYAPNNGSLAYKSDYLYDTRLAAAQPKRRQETAAPAETQPKIRPQKTRIPLSVTLRERKVGIKLTAFLFVALIAMSALLVVLRFERIAGVQRDINEINAGIAAAQRGFGELDMDLSSSIDLEAARLAAETAGLAPEKIAGKRRTKTPADKTESAARTQAVIGQKTKYILCSFSEPTGVCHIYSEVILQ